MLFVHKLLDQNIEKEKRNIMKKIIGIALVTLICILFVGCAEVKTTIVKSKSNYDLIWKACIDSVSDVQFSVSSTDPVSGLIIADQAVLGSHGKVSR